MSHAPSTPIPADFLQSVDAAPAGVAADLQALQAANDVLANADHAAVEAAWEATLAPLIAGMNVASVLLLMTGGIEAALRASPPGQAQVARLGVAHMILNQTIPTAEQG